MKRVLIVDDAGFICEVLRTICESLGYQVVGEAGNGEDGVTMITQLKPDVVFMDLVMPKMNGSEAIFKIRELGLKVKVIACSTLSEKEGPLVELKPPYDIFLEKPFTKESVKSALQEVFRG